jgi:hypothetical protein
VAKPTVTAALVVAVVLVAAIAAGFALLAGSSEPKALEVPPLNESVVIYPDGRDPDEPIACMFQLYCLMKQIEEKTSGTAMSPTEVAPTTPPPPEPIPAEVLPATV